MTSILNERQASQFLNISPSMLRKWRMNRERLPFIKMGGRVLYKESDLTQFLESCCIHPQGDRPKEVGQ